MTNPVFWLGLSILLLALGLIALVCVSVPALIGLSRAARSAEKLFDTLDRELPRTLEAMRHTGADLSGLADDMTDGISSARNIVKHVDHGISDVRQQAVQAQRTTRSVAMGFRAAWRVLTKPAKPSKKSSRSKRRPPIKPQAKKSSQKHSSVPPSNSVDASPDGATAGGPSTPPTNVSD
ncbi:MAG: DUF948 domain-containing protein [Cyanobacteria bacterium P01_D01_bin.156]